MTDEPNNEPDPYPDTKMSEETRKTIGMVRTMMVDAELEHPPAYTLFNASVLELCGRLFASDDYWSDDGWVEMQTVKERAVEIFTAHEAALGVEWRTMYHCWIVLSNEAHQHKQAQRLANS